MNQAPATELPPGDYYIGDPCYVMATDHDKWIDILEACDYFQEPYTDKGQTAVAFSPAWGDGVYLDQDGREYSVDAGLIGAVPVSLLDVSLEEIEERSLGHIVRFTEPFVCKADGAMLLFGHIAIDTDPVREEPNFNWGDPDFLGLDEEEEEIYEES